MTWLSADIITLARREAQKELEERLCGQLGASHKIWRLSHDELKRWFWSA
jgi:hypothetical protein